MLGKKGKRERELWNREKSQSGNLDYADSIQDYEAPELRLFPCRDEERGQPWEVCIWPCLPVQIEVQDSTGLDYVESPDEGSVGR